MMVNQSVVTSAMEKMKNEWVPDDPDLNGVDYASDEWTTDAAEIGEQAVKEYREQTYSKMEVVFNGFKNYSS